MKRMRYLGVILIGGSFNLTKNANERNLERSIFEDNPEIAGRTNFNRRLDNVGAVAHWR